MKILQIHHCDARASQINSNLYHDWLVRTRPPLELSLTLKARDVLLYLSGESQKPWCALFRREQKVLNCSKFSAFLTDQQLEAATQAVHLPWMV